MSPILNLFNNHSFRYIAFHNLNIGERKKKNDVNKVQRIFFLLIKGTVPFRTESDTDGFKCFCFSSWCKETLSDNFHGAKEILLDNFAFILGFGQKLGFIVHSWILFMPNWNQCERVFGVGEGRDPEKTNLYKTSVEIVLRRNIPG